MQYYVMCILLQALQSEAALAALAVTQLKDEQLEIFELLGQGGSGSVYRGAGHADV